MTFPNVLVPKNQWVDLYALSGVDSSKAVQIQNLSNRHIKISYSVDQPTDLSSYNEIPPSEVWVNKATDGAWAYSIVSDALVAVSEA